MRVFYLFYTQLNTSKSVNKRYFQGFHRYHQKSIYSYSVPGTSRPMVSPYDICGDKCLEALTYHLFNHSGYLLTSVGQVWYWCVKVRLHYYENVSIGHLTSNEIFFRFIKPASLTQKRRVFVVMLMSLKTFFLL